MRLQSVVMSQEDQPQNLSGLEMDLLKSFQPSWVKESSFPDKLSRFSEEAMGPRQDERLADFGEDSDFRHRRKPHKTQRLHRPHGSDNRDKPHRHGGEKPHGHGGKKLPFRKDGPRRPREERQPASQSPRIPDLQGWELKFIPEPRGVEGLIKQIKTTAKAYSLFELARLVLEKSPRYLLEFRRKDGPAFFQCVKDGTLWLTRADAAKWILQSHLESFYRRESVEVEAPKGIYPVIAQCGMSGVFLGPPNHHDYQMRIRRIHSERFANVPFDIYKTRIRMLRDEESINKWKQEQSMRDVFHPIAVAEGAEVAALASLAEVEEHFLKNLAATEILDPGENFTIPGSAAVNDSAPAVIELARRELDNLIRFPLPIAHLLGQDFNKAGLQIFKAHENITYVSVARPRPIDRAASPVSASLSAILDYLETHPAEPRAKQWQALLAQVVAPEGSEATARETALLRDFYWLLHQGHVVDYASKGLEIPRRQPAKPAAPPKANLAARAIEPALPVAEAHCNSPVDLSETVNPIAPPLG
jgi:hypothetical protein